MTTVKRDGDHCNNVFSLIIPELDNAAIRRTDDGRVSAYDIIEVIGDQKNPHEVWKRLSMQYPEVLTKCENFKFPGRGQRETPVVNREGTAYLVGLLPGVMGRKYREAAANLVLRYLDADIRIAESIVERNNNPDELRRVEARARGKQKRLAVTGTWQTHGVTEPWQFGYCTNRTYEGLYGFDASGLKVQKNLPSKANLRDAMGTQELIGLAFTEDLIDRKVRQDNPQGHKACGKVCLNTGRKVADFVKDVLES